MDGPSLSVELQDIKYSLEDLSKEELVEKCRSLLTLAQKGRLGKDALQEEVDVLKPSQDPSVMEKIESFSEQELEFVSTIDTLKVDKAHLITSIGTLKIELEDAEKHQAAVDTETQALKRQITRMLDENGQLLTHLDDLEKQNEYLNKIGLEQREQLLCLEQAKLNDHPNVEELQRMLSRSLEEIKNLKCENARNKLKSEEDLQNAQQLVDVLQNELLDCTAELNNLKELCLARHSPNQITELELIIAQNKKEIDAKTKELESIAVAADDLNTDLHKNKALVEVMRSEIKNTNSRLSDNQIISSGITSDLENENGKLREKNKLYHGKIIKFAGEIRKLKIDKENVLSAFKNYNSNVKTWKEKLEKLSTFLCDELIRNNKSSADIIKLAEENDQLKANNSVLEVEISNSLKSADLNHISEEYVNTLKRENAELLREMNDMNQALKERGESISQHQSDYENLLKQHEVDLNNMLVTISDKDQTIYSLLQKQTCNPPEGGITTNTLTKEMNECADVEIGNAKDTLNIDISKDYNECETMSTSTISRADDLGRFKDLDTSWEDRYSRLRSLALKQKAKIRDLTSQLNDAESNNSNLNSKLNGSVQTVRALQGQCDAVQDKLDKTKAESSQYLMKLESIAQDVSRDKIALVANDDVISALKCHVERMEKDKANTEMWKKQVSVKVQSLKKELEANVATKRDLETKISDLTTKLDQKDRLLREETNRHSLQEFNNEFKKQSVLNLEMQHYERTGRELNQRLEMRTEECIKLQEQVNLVNRISNAQLDQIQILEGQLAKLDNELMAARQALTDMQKKSSDLETALSDKEIAAVDLMVSYEEAKREIEDLNLHLSKFMAEQLKSLDSSRSDKDALQLQVLGLEQHLTEVEESLRLRNLELTDVNAEYDGYKVRAQSVLRQNQTCDTGLEEKLSEEADSLRSCMNIMRNECDELRNALSDLKVNNDALVMQKLLVDNKIVEMQRMIDVENEKYSVLSEKYDATINEHSENIKILKVQSDTLVSCYRAKLQEVESRHSQDILQMQAHVNQSTHLHARNIAEHIPILGAPTSVPPPMVREAAEGSESLDNVSTVTGLGTALIQQHPLEQLLDGGVSSVDVPSLRRQLINNESRVTHLTDLLADTEQDLAKHIQMNLMLKEEIRRQQRSVEREKHAENLEYMKNIIVKFITLTNGDERQRLVPVLNTILKLSPDETQRINAIAKGEYKGWSNYLPAWSK